MTKAFYILCKKDNKGSAIITGLVVSTVLIVLCLSLLLVSYSLFLSLSKNSSDLSNREMLFSAVEAFEYELTDDSLDISNVSTDNIGIREYIYNSIKSGEWKAYTGSNENESFKYFSLTPIGSVKVVVQLYWQKASLNLVENISEGDAASGLAGSKLNAIYRLYNNKGEILVKTERSYILNCQSVISDTDDTDTEGESGDTGSETDQNDNTQSQDAAEPHDDGNRPELNTEHVINNNENDNNISIKLIITGANYDNSTGYWGSITISNESDSDLENWRFYVYSNDELSSNGDGSLNKISQGKYLVENKGYNQDLKKGESCSISISCASGYFNTLPTAELIKEVRYPVSKSDYEVSYITTNSWDNGYNGKFIITNNSEKPILDWNLQVIFNGDITSIPNADIKEKNGNNYTLINKGSYGYNIPANSSLEIGFGGTGTPPETVTDYILWAFLNDPSEIANTTVSELWKWERIGSENLKETGGDPNEA
ncbi:MAG: cellulose binding domain-containing protein [Lachnospiraceae bacterium]|nr:cellulose binding domain-containing protein [Lachnospiraceae bacterium]